MDKYGRVIAFAIIEQDEELVCLPFWIKDGKTNTWFFGDSDSYNVVPAPPGLIVAFEEGNEGKYVILTDPVNDSEFNKKNVANIFVEDEWVTTPVVHPHTRKEVPRSSK